MSPLFLVELVVLEELKFVSNPLTLVNMRNMHVFNANFTAVSIL